MTMRVFDCSWLNYGSIMMLCYYPMVLATTGSLVFQARAFKVCTCGHVKSYKALRMEVAVHDDGCGVGVVSAREFVGWYNGDPELSALSLDLSGSSAVILGVVSNPQSPLSLLCLPA
jgi:hypothetical protein